MLQRTDKQTDGQKFRQTFSARGMKISRPTLKKKLFAEYLIKLETFRIKVFKRSV